MDKQYNTEMKNIFGTNYNVIQSIILDTKDNQLTWAKSINDSAYKITEPWYSQFVALTDNVNFESIETDAAAFSVNKAMSICYKYNLKTIRGFALAFDITVQNGSVVPKAAEIIDAAIKTTPNIPEKDLLGIIANAVADSSDNNIEDVRSRKLAIVNGTGTVHGFKLNLDTNYKLSDANWR
jgi:hypothetical protein